MDIRNKSFVPARQEVPVTDPDPQLGLRRDQVELRAACGWRNTVSAGAGRTEKEIILQNCLTFFNMVFLVLAVVLLVCGVSPKNMTFLVIVVINTVIGCVQEIRAKRAVEKLTLIAAQPVKAVRDGQKTELPATELVRDDIVEFAAGDQICADAVVRRGQMQVNESLITGEADAIVKKPGDKLMSGSFVVAGRGYAQLTQVGNDAFAAKLAAEAKANPAAAKSEMMRSLDKLIRWVGFALIPIGLLLFYLEYFKLQLGLTKSAEATVAALVGMIPEGLYLLTSIAMAASALKLTKQRVLVQDMNCIETLARVDVLCVDKTGTITEPKMEVANVVPLSNLSPERLEAVCTAMYAVEEPENDTARAIREMFDGESNWKCTKFVPFTSQTKWMGCVFAGEGAFLAGAPELIMGARYAELQEQVDSGYRALLVAAYDGDPEPGKLDSTLVTPLALILLSNRIRPEAPETFRYFAQQGVSVRVISGDNPATAADVAQRAGIPNARKYMDTSTLESEEDFLEAVKNYTVFGRVTPDKKKKLIQAFHKQGHVVAMTGDGVNDVLAMREADCGIAMAGGAQAASQVSQLLLLDSDFSAMPGIVGEGRRVINNIQRAATLFLVKNIFSLGLSLLSFFTSWPYPLVPLHLSVISSLTIGIPSFFLAMEPNYERVQGRFLSGVLRRAFPGGLTNIFVVLMAQAYMAVFGLALDQTSTICAAILAVVGMLVLYQVCKPFDKFRIIIWWSMVVLLIICFTLLGTFLELRTGSISTGLVMTTLLIMTPSVFFAMRRVFDWGDKVYARIQRRRERKHADL